MPIGAITGSIKMKTNHTVDVISSPIKCQVPALPAPQQLAIMPPNSAVVPSTSRVSNIIDINLHDLVLFVG
jgi:hypothetical protein